MQRTRLTLSKLTLNSIQTHGGGVITKGHQRFDAAAGYSRFGFRQFCAELVVCCEEFLILVASNARPQRPGSWDTFGDN